MKFTRYRRWTRIAILQELVDAASAEEIESERHSFYRSDTRLAIHAIDKPQTDSGAGGAGTARSDGLSGSEDTSLSLSPKDENDDSHKLRKRLKAFIG